MPSNASAASWKPLLTFETFDTAVSALSCCSNFTYNWVSRCNTMDSLLLSPKSSKRSLAFSKTCSASPASSRARCARACAQSAWPSPNLSPFRAKRAAPSLATLTASPASFDIQARLVSLIAKWHVTTTLRAECSCAELHSRQSVNASLARRKAFRGFSSAVHCAMQERSQASKRRSRSSWNSCAASCAAASQPPGASSFPAILAFTWAAATLCTAIASPLLSPTSLKRLRAAFAADTASSADFVFSPFLFRWTLASVSLANASIFLSPCL
mmetsp:Transcript_86193/g.278981  ORF Transcript_86193/g.278981 Transcript_86193/m.278981 type:complete len:271 (-) Transcript_86193:607-1419(-)